MHPYIQHQLAGTRRRGRLLVRLAVALPLAAAGLGAAALVGAPAQAAATTTTFSYTGGEQTYSVPAGATAVTVTAIGALGGIGGGFAGVGGPGAVVTATVPLPAGTTTLYVEVGGRGAIALGGDGGFNGGGPGTFGGEGGGASDVRTTSIAAVPDSALTSANDSRLVVAGGGGGGGYGGDGVGGCNNQGGNGGTAGDTTVTGPGSGGNGTIVCSAEPFTGGDGGLGGTAGGAGGVGGHAAGPPCIASSGSLGQGGQSLFPGPACGGFAGGGGGGYYGGGAGGVAGESDVDIVGGGGGGAGSSYWVPGATDTSMSENEADMPAQVRITPVIPAVATSTSVASSVNPSVSGQQVTFTATVTAAQGTVTPAGTVQFSIDGSPAGSPVTLDSSGQATYSTAALSVTSGTDHTVTADYTPGSGGFAASSGSLPGGQQVGKAATATTLKSSANPSIPRQAVTYTATVSPAGGGSVTFDDGGKPVTSCTAMSLNGTGQATCRVTYTGPGGHTITAVYSGDTAHAGSVSAALRQRVVPDKADLRVTLRVPARAGDGASVAETVTVTNHGPAPAGAVVTTLTEPGGLTVTNLGGARMKGRVLTWATTSLAPGASVTLTVTARAAARARGTVLVAARARSATPDPDLANNAASSRLRLG